MPCRDRPVVYWALIWRVVMAVLRVVGKVRRGGGQADAAAGGGELG
jgi:hypothetical protein